MAIIFLDIDGVLRVRPKPRFPRQWSRRACANLGCLLDAAPEAKLVISSFWRIGRELAELATIFASIGIDPARVIGKTPELPGQTRADEIRAWLAQNPTHSYVAFDDNQLSSEPDSHFIRVDFRTGLGARECVRALDVLTCGVRTDSTELKGA